MTLRPVVSRQLWPLSSITFIPYVFPPHTNKFLYAMIKTSRRPISLLLCLFNQVLEDSRCNRRPPPKRLLTKVLVPGRVNIRGSNLYCFNSMYKVQVNLNSFLFRSLINTSVTTRNIIFTDMQNDSLPNDIFIYLIVIRNMNEREWMNSATESKTNIPGTENENIKAGMMLWISRRVSQQWKKEPKWHYSTPIFIINHSLHAIIAPTII